MFSQLAKALAVLETLTSTSLQQFILRHARVFSFSDGTFSLSYSHMTPCCDSGQGKYGDYA